MSTADKYAIVPGAGYLAAEAAGLERHEPVGGEPCAMAGETTIHNEHAQNLLAAVCEQVRGRGCRLFIHPVKLRQPVASSFQPPDLRVPCDPCDTAPGFIQHPRLIIEALSEHTQQTDRREKLFAYLQIPALEAYAPVSSRARKVVVHRHAAGWRPQPLAPEAAARTPESLGHPSPLARLYADVEL